MSQNQPPEGGQQGFGEQPDSGPQYQGPQGPGSQPTPPQYGQPGQTGQPGQYTPPQYRAPGQYSQPGAYGQPAQQYGQPGQYGQPPQYGQPGQPPAGPQGQYRYPPGGPQQPKSGNSRVLIIVGAVVLALIVVGVAVGVNLRKTPTTTDMPGPQSSTGTGGGTNQSFAKPSDAAKAYLEALASGKADAVLATMTEQPADKTFLTDTVLAASIKAAPITAINVPEVSDEYAYSVDASYKLGNTPVNADIRVDKQGDSWKVSKGVVDLDVSYQRADTLPMLIDGVAVKADKIKLFPGSYTFTTGIKNIDYGKSNVLVVQNPTDYADATDIKPTLTNDGKGAFIAAVKANVSECLKSKKLANEGCPNNVGKVTGTYKPKDGSIKWTSGADDPYANLDVTLDYKNPVIASAYISLELKGSAACINGAAGSCYVQPSNGAPQVDLTKSDPTVVWDR